MGYALIAEATGFLVLFGMFGDFGPPSYKEHHQPAVETSAQYIGRSVRVWLGIALFRGFKAKGRHSYEWCYPSGRQHQVRAIYA